MACNIGYAAPFTPTRAQLRSSRLALAMHRRGDFDDAVQAFAALVAEAPGYGSARFNLACSQARAGQLPEAKATLVTLFCEDLPTNLPRALGDEDLAPLRSDMEALGAALVPRYREASAGGVFLVAFGRTGLGDGGDYAQTELVWSQPGLWKDQTFVPAGPRQQSRTTDYTTPMFPSFVTGDRVVQVETVSSSAEADFLPPLHVVERTLFDGVTRSEARFDESQNEIYGVHIGVRDGQTYVRFDAGTGDAEHRTNVLATRRVMPNPPMESAQIEFGMSRWTPTGPSAAVVSQNRRTLRFETRTLELDAAHRRLSNTRVITDAGVALVYSSNVGDCGYPDRYLAEALDLTTGTSLWKESGEGQRLFHFQGGQLWMQTEDALLVFEDPRQNEGTPLPAGLGLSSLFLAFNPMC